MNKIKNKIQSFFTSTKKTTTRLLSKLLTLCKQLWKKIEDSNHAEDVKTTLMLLLIVSVCFSLPFATAKLYDRITTNRFEKLLIRLSEQECKNTEIPILSNDNMDKLSPVANSESIYQNENFFLFYLTPPPMESAETFNVAVYIQKPNNVTEFFIKDWYGNILTDKSTISISLRASQTKHNLDALQVNKSESIVREENYIINGLTFESYRVKGTDYSKYYMISEIKDNVCLVYTFSHNSNTQYKGNENFLSHIKLVEEPRE